MRASVAFALLAVDALLVLASGCVELGVVSDGTTISVGKPNRGHIVDGVRIPDKGEGFVTPDTWKRRGNRYGTDELVDVLTAVARRMTTRSKPRLVIADLSAKGGGEAHQWHRSHQSGRDVDLLFYVRDASGKPVEPDAMRTFGPDLKAKDGSGYTVDVERTWLLVRELLTAREAPVQWVFMYQALADQVIAHAEALGEPADLVAKARLAVKQPGPRAPHDDHMHVRVYCSKQDRAFGCIDIGPMELLAMYEAEAPTSGTYAAMSAPRPPVAAPAAVATEPAPSGATPDLRTLGRMLRARPLPMR